jgi:penicillin-binding protein 2A
MLKTRLSPEGRTFLRARRVAFVRILVRCWRSEERKLEARSRTLSLQLVKNTCLTGVKTISRKLQKPLWPKLEQVYSKDKILEMYLNYIYFGNGLRHRCTQKTIRRHAKELSWLRPRCSQAYKGAFAYAPHIISKKIVERRNLVLSVMREQGHDLENVEKEAKRRPLYG